MWTKRTIFILSLGAIFLSYYIYTPLPHDITEPWKIRVLSVAYRTGTHLAWAGSFLGIDSFINIARKFIALKNTTFDEPNIKVLKAHFDGVPVRIFSPITRSNKLSPGLVYFHGGAFVMETDGISYAMLKDFVKKLGIVVIYVKYPLAPENRYPAAHDACEKAAVYFLKNSPDFGVDPSRIAIMGTSAGGNMAASLARTLTSRNTVFKPKLQVLVSPILQAVNFMLPSYQLSNFYSGIPFTDMDLLSHFLLYYYFGQIDKKLSIAIASNTHVPDKIRNSQFKEFVNVDLLPEKYLQRNYNRHNNIEEDLEVYDHLKDMLNNEHLFPLMSRNLTGLPLTFILTCEYDILRDEGILYAKRLQASGNKVELYNLGSGIHAINYLEEFHLYKFANEKILNFLKEYL